ncbi:nuclear transport factor 2 family protein [Pseudoduganella chitinolytica]|uniref:Nuclear transport factor 2 family protein n=1 Tax=Pseudoduganella chitinolytica TaxID=34070 RepID=A0ABY8BIH8_9BURK|nr:nuclear transport factor 2 family protein [Pseudoduganella chitinolytica]WEF34731.1 nuclear transport factor 2 family protein [Pseudoduganella chitinolytica]
MKHALACGIYLFLAQLAYSPALAASAQPSQRAAEDDVEAQLLALERRRADAIVRRDIPALRDLMDRYYRHVESRGRVRSKTDLLTALERGEFRFQFYESETAEVQLLPGGQAAVVAGVFRSQQPGRKLFRGRYVRVWVRAPDGWKNTFHQGTEIRQAADRCPCE